ncbi:MAG: RdgB/HAM1 family non-canonical purine NTP pyrophosphatase [Acidimicrobiales bacterium]
MTQRLVLASANPDKAADIRAILRAAAGECELLARPADVPDVDETGETLEDNARLKAMALLDATGIASVADDTGLEVDALGGAPGVYSARYAGAGATYADNVAKLLSALDGVPPESRTARFSTVALAVFPDGSEIVASGSVGGWIAEAGRGQNGFGYDPVFVPDGGDGRTFAEMSPPEKHSLSHRGRAFRALAAGLAGRADD